MKAEYYVHYLQSIVKSKDSEKIKLLANKLEQYDEAKEALNEKGYGVKVVTLMDIIKEEVPQNV